MTFVISLQVRQFSQGINPGNIRRKGTRRSESDVGCLNRLEIPEPNPEQEDDPTNQYVATAAS